MLKKDKEAKIVDNLYNLLNSYNKNDLIEKIIDNKDKIYSKTYLDSFIY